MDKLRTKTEIELVQQGEALAKARDVLLARGVRPLLTGGTLLGAMREGDFIPWDWDAEFFVKYEEVKHLGAELIEDFKRAGFTLPEAELGKRGWKLEPTMFGFRIEIRSWYQSGSYYVRNAFRFPAKYVAEADTITLRGEAYQAPRDYDGYLTYVYGDWRTPLKTAVKSKYLKKGFYNPKRYTLRNLISYIRRKLIK